jgi:nicotinate-nucleotide pyrophosphorylase (carboxylating)
MRLSIGPRTRQLVETALDEDAASMDPSAAVFSDDDRSVGRLVAKQPLVVCGHAVAALVFEHVDREIDYTPELDDGVRVDNREVLGTVAGPTGAILRAERTALNFMQRLSGIATKTARFVDALDDPETDIVDTRKTLPGYRHLDKYAVRCGGGKNHRYNLAGGIIVKDNHIAAAGSIAEAIRRVRQEAPHTLNIEVEVESLEGLEEALEAEADIVMLDNMSTDTMARAVELVRDRVGDDVLLEASGNVTLERLPELGGLGLDFISSGALTHSVSAADISLQFE